MANEVEGIVVLVAGGGTQAAAVGRCLQRPTKGVEDGEVGDADRVGYAFLVAQPVIAVAGAEVKTVFVSAVWLPTLSSTYS